MGMAGMSELESLVKDLIARRAKHNRKGTVLGDEGWCEVRRHFVEECGEAASDMTCIEVAGYGETSLADELGDVLGIIVHAAHKLGYTMAEIEQLEIAKLKERYS